MTRTHWTAAIAAAAIAACLLPGCGKTKCQMDTECPLPQLCVAGECVYRASDSTVEVDAPDTSLDPWDADGELDLTDTDEIPDSLDADTVDTAPSCTPALPTPPSPRLTFAPSAPSCGASGDPDRPGLFLIEGAASPVVWVIGRIVSGDGAEKLSYRSLNYDSGIPSSSLYSFAGNLTLDVYHPTAKVDGGIVTLYADLIGVDAYKLFYMVVPYTSGLPVTSPTAWDTFDTSDSYSRQPAVASNGAEIMGIWRQGCDACITSRINFERINLAGTSLGSGTLTGDGTVDLGEPRIVYNGSGYGLVSFAYLGAGADRVDFLAVDTAGGPVAGSQASFTASPGMTLVGYPAIEWNGSKYGLLWEEVGGGTAHLHFSTIDPAAAYATSDVTLEGTLASSVGGVTEYQDGMVDLAWSDDGFGAVWIYKNLTSGADVWFFEVDEGGTVIDGPVTLSTGTNAYNPALVWYNPDQYRYWSFVWNEFSSGMHLLYSFSYGCCWNPSDPDCS